MQDHIKPYVSAAKTHLRGLSDVKATFADVQSAMMREVEAIQTLHGRDEAVSQSAVGCGGAYGR